MAIILNGESKGAEGKIISYSNGVFLLRISPELHQIVRAEDLKMTEWEWDKFNEQFPNHAYLDEGYQKIRRWGYYIFKPLHDGTEA